MERLAQAHNPEQLSPCAGKPATEVLLEQYRGSPQLDQASFDARKVMLETRSLHRPEPDPLVRTLKIEADGDFWRGAAKPKIRLMGRWLERAGFSPGSRVQVTCVAPGIIELRTPAAAGPPKAHEEPFGWRGNQPNGSQVGQVWRHTVRLARPGVVL